MSVSSDKRAVLPFLLRERKTRLSLFVNFNNLFILYYREDRAYAVPEIHVRDSTLFSTLCRERKRRRYMQYFYFGKVALRKRSFFFLSVGYKIILPLESLLKMSIIHLGQPRGALVHKLKTNVDLQPHILICFFRQRYTTQSQRIGHC